MIVPSEMVLRVNDPEVLLPLIAPPVTVAESNDPETTLATIRL